MRKIFLIESNDAGQRVDKFLAKALPALPYSLLYKGIRQKDVRLNQARCQPGDKLSTGDEVRVFFADNFFAPRTHSLMDAHAEIDVVFEDENILLVNKPQGLLVHEDDANAKDTLILRILSYLHQAGQWDPAREQSFTPALCNRIDRNTSGIVIAAKRFEALQILTEKIRLREVTKKYLCVIHGRMTEKSGILKGYLLKDEKTKTVRISTTPLPGAKTALTKYRVLAEDGDKSLVEAELLTGRTHQIRAQFAAAGHPLFGDAKYGASRENARIGNKQALCAYYVSFDFTTPAGSLDYLAGKHFSIEVPFARDFSDYRS